MPMIQLDVPPGFVRKGTEYSQQGRWREGNLVRWVGASLQNLGGWQQITMLDDSSDAIDIPGTVRSIHAWKDNLLRTWIAFGSTEGLFAWDGSTLHDITPTDIVLPGESVGAIAGYGTGLYGTGDYNEPVGADGGGVSGSAIEYGYWHLDNEGENLVASIGSDGRVFTWSPLSPTDEAEPVTNAPEYVRGVAVTAERIMVVIGAREEVEEDVFAPRPRRVQWANQEDSTVWTPAPTNMAGDLDLVTEGAPVRIFRFKNETLIFTDADVHRMVFIDYPLVYRLEKIGDACGIANPGAVAKNSNMVFWVGPRGFFVYDGNQVNSINSELFNTPGDAAALLARNGRTSVGHNEQFGEFMIHYASVPEGNPDRYIIWNYGEGWWADGVMDRSCWYDSHVTEYPLAVQPYDDTEGDHFSRVYMHEVGSARPNYDGPAERVVSAPIEIGKGDQFITVDRVMQDSDINEHARLRVGFSFYKAPNVSPLKVIAPTPLNTTRGYTDVRGCGRMVAIEIVAENTVKGGAWRVGKWRFNAEPGDGR